MLERRGSVLILVGGFVIAVLTWLLDSVVDYTTAAQGLTFVQMVITPPLHAVFARSMLAVTILLVSWAASHMVGVLADRNRRIGQLNSDLETIRDVNKLLVRERDVEKLLTQVCSLLARRRAYPAVWVAYLSESGELRHFCSDGLGDGHQELQQRLCDGDLPACAEQSARAPGALVLAPGSDLCADCLCAPSCAAGAIITPLRHAGRLLGYLCISLALHSRRDAAEAAIVHEIADDLALGLYGVESEADLRRNEERFRLLFDRAVDAIFIHDLDARIVEANQTASEWFGYSREEFLQISPERLVAGATRERLIERVDELLQAASSCFEGTMVRRDGSTFEAEINGRVIEYEGQRRLLNIVRDVGQRKQHERELQELGRFREAIIDQANTAVVVFDPTGRVVVWNAAMAEISGYAAEDVMGKWAWSRLLANEREVAQVQQMIQAAIRSGESFADTEVIIRTAGGEERLLSWHARRLADESGNAMGAVAIGRDITRQRELERRLERSQRLEAIGRLAAGVAHDFNNILTVIMGNAQLLESEPLSAEARMRLAEIKEAGQRSADLTHQLVTFGRRARREPRVFDLNEAVREMQPMLTRLVSKPVRVEFSLSPDVVPVRADRTQIEQIILNLQVNARDAIRDGGVITLSTGRTEISPAEAALMTEIAPGPYVTLSVSDTGSGIDETTLERIFEPFFTTRNDGTGLGLATVYGAVRENEGNIDVASTVGSGTTFTIYLPLAQEEMVPEQA